MLTNKLVYLVCGTDYFSEWFMAQFDDEGEAKRYVECQSAAFPNTDYDYYYMPYTDNGNPPYMRDFHHCKGCRTVIEVHERCDYYGIFTGHYCDDCYENNYPYRKDRYPTMEYDGYGDYLEDDY